MSFVKLDCDILNSSIWLDKSQRDIFIVALLMAVPMELKEPRGQLDARTMKPTKWSVPKGWYGFVSTSSRVLINKAGFNQEEGYAALEALGAPDLDSKSTAYEGRRMVRVENGFIVLNYVEYRERDHTTAERSRRWREKKKAEMAKGPLGPRPANPRATMTPQPPSERNHA